ncbi:hypothetical protein C0991_001335 [Blastosporella zonata]|nr:hypothetical protein C0991_001335 [Blastosporella zonata]
MEIDTTPRAANDGTLAQYVGGVPITGAPNGALSWPEADHHHGLNFFGPSLDPWQEDAIKYVDVNHPMIMNGHELDRLSDNSTPTDSDSHGSSNAFSTGSLPSNVASSFTQDADWQHFPVTVTYSPHGHSEFIPAMDSAASLFSLIDDDISNSFLLHSSSDVLSPTINPATFNDTPTQERSAGQIRPHPHPDSPTISASLESRPCVSLSELNAPYIPEESVDDDSKALSSSNKASPEPSSRKRARSFKSRGRGRSTGVPRSRVVRQSNSPPIMGTSRTRRRAPSFTSSSSSEISDSPPLFKRSRLVPENVKEDTIKNERNEDGGESEVSDSDVYSPSPSPSFDASESDYSESGSFPLSHSLRKPSKKSILKMSAADALAQLSGSTSSVMSFEVDGEWEVTDGTCSTSSRRNQSIPVPVPVPHLTKKSRGRKVPYVNTRVARGLPTEDALYDGDDDDNGRIGSSSLQGRGRGGGRSGGGGRSFVCTVEGCGKCFIRGEHLKRHVRSIHTNDKPHACPYPGCGKSFSRRDNLGQHVRLHLAGAA